MIPKKKPPPNRLTVSRAGFSRSQNRNQVLIGGPTNGTVEPGGKAQVLEAEHPDRDVREVRAEPGGDALRRDPDVRRIGEPVERDEFAERLDERQRPGELEARELDVDLGLLAFARSELDPLEGQDQDLEIEREVVQGAGDDQRLAGCLDRQDQVARAARLEDRRSLEAWPPVEPGGEALWQDLPVRHVGEEARVDARHGRDEGLDCPEQHGLGPGPEVPEWATPSRTRRARRAGS